MNQITFSDFAKVDMRVGTIIHAEVFHEAKIPAYKVTIDFGAIGIKKTSAQITKLYQSEDLLHKQVVAVVNFPPKQIANFMSECLILGVVGDENLVSLLSPNHKMENGLKIG